MDDVVVGDQAAAVRAAHARAVTSRRRQRVRRASPGCWEVQAVPDGLERVQRAVRVLVRGTRAAVRATRGDFALTA